MSLSIDEFVVIKFIKDFFANQVYAIESTMSKYDKEYCGLMGVADMSVRDSEIPYVDNSNVVYSTENNRCDYCNHLTSVSDCYICGGSQ